MATISCSRGACGRMAVRSTAGGRVGVATESRATMAPPPPHRGSIAAPTGFVRGCRSRGTCGRGRCAAPSGGAAARRHDLSRPDSIPAPRLTRRRGAAPCGHKDRGYAADEVRSSETGAVAPRSRTSRCGSVAAPHPTRRRSAAPAATGAAATAHCVTPRPHAEAVHRLHRDVAAGLVPAWRCAASPGGGAVRQFNCHAPTHPGGAPHRHAATRAAATQTLRRHHRRVAGGAAIQLPDATHPGGAPHRPRPRVPAVTGCTRIPT